MPPEQAPPAHHVPRCPARRVADAVCGAIAEDPTWSLRTRTGSRLHRLTQMNRSTFCSPSRPTVSAQSWRTSTPMSRTRPHLERRAAPAGSGSVPAAQRGHVLGAAVLLRRQTEDCLSDGSMRIRNLHGRAVVAVPGGTLDLRHASGGRLPSEPHELFTRWDSFHEQDLEEGVVLPDGPHLRPGIRWGHLHDPCSRPAATDHKYTLDREEPLSWPHEQGTTKMPSNRAVAYQGAGTGRSPIAATFIVSAPATIAPSLSGGRPACGS